MDLQVSTMQVKLLNYLCTIFLYLNFIRQGSSYSAKHIGPILETALQRALSLYIQTRNIQGAINRYREILSAIETTMTQSLRVSLTRQLAELLIRGINETVYKPPDIPNDSMGK